MDELTAFMEQLEDRITNYKDEILGMDENDSMYSFMEGCIETMEWVLTQLAEMDVPITQ